MPEPRINKGLAKSAPKVREGQSKAHLAMVRKLPCCVCGPSRYNSVMPIVAHHLLRTGEHGMGRKSSDRWALSLCDIHHKELHANGDEEAYLMSHGIDGRSLASSLWAARGDLEAMERVVFRFKQRARTA
jgi:hypothetical protein